MRLFRILFTTIFLAAILQASGLEYLNALRHQAGLSPFTPQANLDDAAKNHSTYLQLNDTHGHYETSGKQGFTGVEPWERVVYAQYPSRYVGENVSVGTETLKQSVDGLFAAIYHRFGFLSLVYDEIGIGISDDMRHYTYNMGNSKIRELCLGDNYSGGAYYNGMCADTNKKIDSDLVMEVFDGQKAGAPDIIIWPPADGSDIPPVFYEENPDPLPAHSVTGYPVSVEFNDGTFDETPELETFRLEDASGSVLEQLVLMDAHNDPNDHFSSYQFALFPEKRLEWGSIYYVELVYDYEGARNTRRWCFATRSLKTIADRVYRLENDTDATLHVVSGIRYAVYVVPRDTNDVSNGVQYSTSAEVSFDYIDQNTFLVTLHGEEGKTADFSLSNGQKIRFVISEADTASAPKEEVCAPADDYDGDGLDDDTDMDDDNDGISDSDELEHGLDPKNPDDALEDSDGDGISNKDEIAAGSDLSDPNDPGIDETSDENGTEPSDDKEAKNDVGDVSDVSDENVTKEDTDNHSDTSGEAERPSEAHEDTATDDDAGKEEVQPPTQTPDVEKTPSTVIRLEEGTTGTYRTIEASQIGFSEDGSELHAEIVQDGGLEYHVKSAARETVVVIVDSGSETNIDHDNIATIRPSPDRDVAIEVRPDGRVTVTLSGNNVPETPMPTGTQVKVEGAKIRSTVPLPDRLTF